MIKIHSDQLGAHQPGQTLFIGPARLALTLSPSGPPLANPREIPADIVLGVGGSPLHASRAYAALTAFNPLLGLLTGCDAAGNLVCKRIAEENGGPLLRRIAALSATPLTVHTRPPLNGQRPTTWSNSPVIDEDAARSCLEGYAGQAARFVLCGIPAGEREFNLIQQIIQWAGDRPVVLLPDESQCRQPGRMLRLIRQIRHPLLCLTRGNAAALTQGIRDPRWQIRDLRERAGLKQVIITDGEFGAHSFIEGNSYFTPAFRIKALDHPGAVDSFLGAFLAATDRQQPVGESLRLAAACAAVWVSRREVASWDMAREFAGKTPAHEFRPYTPRRNVRSLSAWQLRGGVPISGRLLARSAAGAIAALVVLGVAGIM